MTESLPGGAAAAPLSMRAAATLTSAAIKAARQLLTELERGRRIDAAVLRSAMEAAFGASDAAGAWNWKTAYDVCEAATVLFLRKFGPAIRSKAGSAAAMLPMLATIASCLPTHTRRSEDSQALQQFSTPIPLGLVACTAAGITAVDRVLEPSAGTGLLAVFAELAGGALILNELAETRAGLLEHLFANVKVTRLDAAQIDDHLDASVVPSVVLMNPPFSAVANVDRRMADAAFRHIASALAHLCDGGRLVAIAGAGLAPDNPAWTGSFVRLQERGRVVFSAAIDGAVYAKHGTQTDTRLLVIDKLPAADPKAFPASQGMAGDVGTLLKWVTQYVPARLPVAVPVVADIVRRPAMLQSAGTIAPSHSSTSRNAPEGVELAYETVKWSPPEGVRLTDALYEEYGLQSIRIPGSCTHPTKLVQSAAMASVAPPKPSYRPHLPSSLVADEVLSDAQIESVIYAGEAHSQFLAGSWTVDTTFDVVAAARDEAENAVRFRRGWFLGDGTGAGKGRQVAGILLDNWLKGRRRAVWISKSDKLIEDAQRDWSALGMERLLVTPLSRFRQGTPIRLSEGILFATYATLRTDERGEKLSRVRQIVEWLGSDFDGVIVFDESHAMQNAAGGKGERGDQAASQQGRAGLRLQHALPNSRVVYVSATGATTVHNLAYAQRLGLWAGADANGLRDDLPPITTFLNRLLALTIGLQNVLFTAFEQLLTARIEGAVSSGTYDLGLETLRAESFVVTDRRTIYVHPRTGAETRLLTIVQRERNHPVGLDDALARRSNHAVLLINERSGRAAVQIPAPSIMLDNGEIERRIRLIRPMEQHQVPLNMMAESHWVEADRKRFAAAWLAELAEVPEFTESTIHVAAGLLLPIWKRLPNESTRVYRLQNDAGERVIGRKVSATWVVNVLAADAPSLTPDAAFAALMDGRTVLDLGEDLQLRRVRVMGAYRIELSGFNDTMRDRLRAYGLFGEIISWKLRMFVPTDTSGVEVLSRVLDTYPVARISEREAA
ncbi:strawberry notch-like NTP hydrolase domain-containing protein [Bradyrhizobium sp. DASA03068]|uniref:strawberry notch-like NTP hydrolase domain-containing protein n=1 Tax=Bradyrhizobium sp. BLXBL-01 TaxID=3395915 RepID=UPI003F70F77C